MNAAKIINQLKLQRDSDNVKGMTRFGINPENALGISIPTLRKQAKEIGQNHKLALELWKSDIHEVRLLATMIDDYDKVTKTQMNNWVKDFNSWDLCDQCCNNLFRKTPFAVEYSFKWTKSKSEFIRRSGFVLMAVLAFHSKDMVNNDFLKYYPIILEHSDDERNFVKKAVNWALRQIGKRNKELHRDAIIISKQLIELESKSAKWIGKNALTELTSVKISAKFK